MPTFQAETSIAADPSHVWATLLQTDRWSRWDPAIERVEGSLGAGGKLTLHVAEVSRPFRLAVAEWRPGSRLVLRGGMPLGLFTGTRTYELHEAEGGTRFRMVETFTGLLAPLIGRTIPDLQPSFEAFTAGLRNAAEATAEA